VSAHEIEVWVNAKKRRDTVSARMSLVDYLRDGLGLFGTHVGCEHGACGCCTVLLDGQPIRSCLFFAVQADNRAVTTVEGLNGPGGELSPVQEAFWDAHGLQCGYCTPGMIIATTALLKQNPDPTERDVREALSGNVCRCTGYEQIVEAVWLAADRMARGGRRAKEGDRR
jgi:carbon-monoxide dehydrogenase small subunit